MEARAWVAFGANLGQREATVLRAARRLNDSGAARLVRLSSLYETDAVGMRDAPPFINTVAEVVALLRPRDLLDRLKGIETELGRTGGHYQSRPIDLDLVAYGDEVTDSADLVLPHPRYHERAFVLIPLREIAAAFRDPRTGRSIDALVAALPESQSVRLASSRGWVVRE
jgi:2-amino-4-hydroxy-6-hydroxymethyldihydropteridine diphosphokinase